MSMRAEMRVHGTMAGCAMLWAAFSADAATSQLWGERGERWNPRGRLPDFSYAGYHAGEAPIPTVPKVASVKDHGCKGDGVTDDTRAFQAALDAAEPGALLIPKGRYLLSGQLILRRNGVVLRGEGTGTDGSVLYWSKSLQELTGAIYPWNWGASGLLRLAPPAAAAAAAPKMTTTLAKSADHPPSRDLALGKFLAAVTAEAKRGDSSLQVPAASAIRAGQFLVLTQTDPQDKSLNSHLHNGQGSNEYNQDMPLRWIVRAKAVAGSRIELQQPLRFNVRLAWKPVLNGYSPIEEAGVENLRFEFPDRTYPGHQAESGFNAFSFEGALNCWARNIVILNCDNGPSIEELSKHCSVLDLLQLPHSRLAINGRISGHHGFSFNINSHDNLLSGFEFKAVFIHGVSVGYNASGNVVRKGKGTALNLDHHSRSPFENLYSDLDLGSGENPFLPVVGAGGDPLRSGARGTIWNVRSAKGPVDPPPFAYTQFNVIGTTRELMTQDREWLEILSAPAPGDLYQSQLDRRLALAVSAKRPIALPANPSRSAISLSFGIRPYGLDAEGPSRSLAGRRVARRKRSLGDGSRL